MEYFADYRKEEFFKQHGFHKIRQYQEGILFQTDIIGIGRNPFEDKDVDRLVRTYHILLTGDRITKTELVSRYKTDYDKEETNMVRAKDNEFVDEIADETCSYSDDSLYNITSFGTDLSFRELITMYDEGDLEKPEMQRNYVWDKNEASRFIDSVLLGLPVPSIFLAKIEDERRLIVDGYQRIMTIYDYVKKGVFGGDGKSFSLSNSENINKKWRGKTFQELLPEEQRKIRNSSIHAIVFEQKEPKDDTGMYQIFERINTGGRTLKPQEIRNCVYHGTFNKLLSELNENADWRRLYNHGSKDARMADIELILRMFAFAYIFRQKEIEQKQINLANYLNVFMKRSEKFEFISKQELEEQFSDLMKFYVAKFNENLFRNGKVTDQEMKYTKKVNPAIVDSVYAATVYVKNTKGLEAWKDVDLNSRYEKLIRNQDYQEVISKRTTNIQNIKKRINLATEILYGEVYGW